MILDYDATKFMIEKTKDSINYLNSYIDSMSKGEKELYYQQKMIDLSSTNKFSNAEECKHVFENSIKNINKNIKKF